MQQGQGHHSLALILAIAVTLFTVDSAVGGVKKSSPSSSFSSYYNSIINAGSNSSHDVGLGIGPLLRERRASRSRRSAFTRDEKSTILKLHNTYRGKAEAADMIMLEWDNTLENKAQRVASTCEHRRPEPPRGQNLWSSANEPDPIDSPVRAWYGEKKDYTYVEGMDNCKHNRLCRHYMQIVRAQSKAVGCAIEWCDPFENIHYDNGYFVVCEYDVGGSETELPYAEGKACSACINDYKYCDNNLCTNTKSSGPAGPRVPLTMMTLSHSGPCNVLFTVTAYAAVAMVAVRGVTLRGE